MNDSEIVLVHPNFIDQLAYINESLSTITSQDRGTRIGQSTVFSQKMHTMHPERPEEVYILQDVDAGQAFYHRRETGSIYHIDVFHQCGLVDHRQVATQIKQYVQLYNDHYDNKDSSIIDDKAGLVEVDYIDVQTGTGGGRITGSLDYGKKLSLRKGHINHVHVAMKLSKKHLACVIYIILAIESAILFCNLELRCNEKIKNINGQGNNKTDMSPYADVSDSLLQEQNNDARHEVHPKNEKLAELPYDLNTAQDLEEVMADRDDNRKGSKPTSDINNRCVTKNLSQEGKIELIDNYTALVKNNKKYEKGLEKYLPEVESHLRQVVQEAKFSYKQTGKSRVLQNKVSHSGEKSSLHNATAGNTANELDLSATISAATRRMVEHNETVFQISYPDLRYSDRQKKKKVEFCLLVDASSSMAGKRIEVAKMLAGYLFLSTTDRIGAIFFQGKRAWLQVPFTRDFRQIEKSLEEIKAYGETPLALGLTACLQYIEATNTQNPVIILITDGVPTVGMITDNPVCDALQVAKEIKTKKYGFTCIGLNPHLYYLKQLSEAAGGSMYIVDELDRYSGDAKLSK